MHVENARQRPGLYQITPERWRAACARHRALGRRLDVSIGWDGEGLEAALKDATILIGVPDRREHLAQRAPRLRWLHHTSAGVDGLLPLDWLPARLAFTNNRGAHGIKAEQYMRMAYTLLNTRMPELIANQRARRWEQVFSPNIEGRTALVVGLGDLGQACVRAAAKLDMKVVGVSRTGKRVPGASAVYPIDKLDRLVPTADFVAVAVPLTSETRKLIDRRRLGLMKPGSGLINIARAPVVDYDALREHLSSGHLGGAVVDVTDPEPLPPDSPLWDTPNLMITPHISCDDSEHYIDITLDLWFANLARFLQRKPLKNRVDARRGY